MISVAMASYNGEKYIVKQLDSIFNQTQKIDELIIVDDVSTDNTVKIVKDYMECHPDYNIRFYENEVNQGYKKNFRNALSYCEGDSIFLCDQDDLWLPEKVETMLKIMKENPQIKVLASSFEFIDQDDKPFTIELLPYFSNNNLYRRVLNNDDLVEVKFNELIIQNSFQGCALCITKEINKRFLDCFTEELFHDWLINLLASEEHAMYFYNHPLFQYRIHNNNTIGINDMEEASKGFQQLIKTSQIGIRTLFAINCASTITILEKVDPMLGIYVPDYEKQKDFYRKHVEYLKNGKPLGILFQNFSPYYKNIKSNRARVMDFFVAFKRKFFKC